jgi:hypothetical protein
LDLKGDAMADFTLDQYYGISEEELGQILQAEARKMFNSDSGKNDSEEVVNNFSLTSQQKHKKTALILPYWKKIKTLICLPIQIFQKHFQT